MEIKKITFFTSLDDIEDIFDANIDVDVELDDGRVYTLVVATQKNILTLMNNEKSDFLSPGNPMIIVTKLTEEIIEKAIEAYAEKDKGYYLKFYGAHLDNKTLDVLKEREIARKKWLDELDEAGKIEDYDHIDLIDFDINNL